MIKSSEVFSCVKHLLYDKCKLLLGDVLNIKKMYQLFSIQNLTLNPNYYCLRDIYETYEDKDKIAEGLLPNTV